MPQTTNNGDGDGASSSRFTKIAATIATVALVILVTWLKSHPGNSDSVARVGTGQGTQPASGPAAVSGSGRASTTSYDLSRDENLGGHTLQRHVGRTDDQLRERLDRERDISAASTYTDRAAAERTVAAAMVQDHDRVKAWLNRSDSHPNLALQFHGNTPVGRSIRRGEQAAEPCSSAVIVLRWDGDQRFHVLTTYPEADHGR